MIRIAVPADIPAILDIYAPYVLTSTATFEYDVPSLDEFTTRFKTITKQFPWLVWEENGEIMGYAYASPPYTRAAYAWCAESTVYLRPQVRGRGIAKSLYTVLEKILQKQGYRVLYSLICSENTESLRFHRKMDYEFCADFRNCGFKFGRWLGLTWMEKRLNPTDFPSAPPVCWSSVVDNDEIMNNILYSLSLS